LKILSKHSNINFLIYNNRSGSTYLSSLLDGFDEIGVSLESPVFFDLITGKPLYRAEAEIDEVLLHIYADRKFNEWSIPREDLKRRLLENLPLTKRNLVYLILETYFHQIKPGSFCWICKIGNPHLIKEVCRVFENAKFIFIYRDGRAVFCSQKKTFSRNIGDVMEKDPVRSARTWSRYLKVVKKMAAQATIITVKYEDLIQNTEEQLKKIYRFLIGDEYRKELSIINSTNYFNKIPRSQSHLHPNVGKKPLVSRIDGWKSELSYIECYLFEKTAYYDLKEMGYELYHYNAAGKSGHKIQLMVFRMKLFFKRIMTWIKKLSVLIRQPAFAWKKIIIRLETRF
jgi:hypothetical protein